MRRYHFKWSGLVGLTCYISIVSGCEFFGFNYGVAPGYPEQAAQEVSDPVVLAQVEDYATRVNQAALADYGGALREPPEVHWLNMGAQERASKRLSNQRLPREAEFSAKQIEAVGVGQSKIEPEKSETVVDPSLVQDTKGSMSRSELINALAREIRNSNDHVMNKALRYSAISLIDPRYQLDEELISWLDKQDEQKLRKYYEILTKLNARMASGNQPFDREEFDSELDELFGQLPIKIQNVQLCRRTFGYGIYEPFESSTFLAGDDNRMIVYVELDHFSSIQRADKQYEVKLQQELTLFNDADGLAVWRHEPVEIVDISRNQRRDFFMNQRITLPARLSVGKYLLKVSVTDLHGGSIDETTIKMEIVADQSLVSK